ncbi:MAG: carboxypeptidase regulatory-like domain-containing protein [Nitrospirae bacterium]|nr:carboxypeptidase regulatory-like domain-containing protein [Nitrospirota bacterium]
MLRKGLPVFLFMVFLSAICIASDEIETGWISGQMMIKGGGPMSGGTVVFFDADRGPAPDPDKFVRTPEQIGELDQEGKFYMMLPAGRFYMGAMKRMSGEKIGPPLDGDYFVISRDKDGIPVAYIIEKGKSLSVGVIAEAVPFTRKIAEGSSGISGTIVDMSGDPVGGAIVFAYITETMTGIPPFTSYKTGPDGKYFIAVDKGGNYYLRVRDIYGGGPPVTGAVMGGYGEERPAAVAVKSGEITQGITIKVVRHFERGPKGQQMDQAPEMNTQEEMKHKMKEERPKEKH